MIKFSEYLKESFNTKPLPWKQKDQYEYTFTVDGEYFFVVEFEPQAGHEDKVGVDFSMHYAGDVIFTLTNKGNEFKVLTTVIDIIKFYAEKYEPNLIMFTSNKDRDGGKDSKSRSGVYKRLLKRMVDTNKWDVVIKEGTSFFIFKLVKKK